MYEFIAKILFQRSISLDACVFFDSHGEEFELSKTVMSDEIKDRLIIVNYRGV